MIHYLKVIQRDNLGSEKGKQQIEDELNMGLVQYVSDMENPTPEVRARRPLRNAKVQLFEGKTPMDFYHVDLTVTPHFQYMGTSFSLSLQGKL